MEMPNAEPQAPTPPSELIGFLDKVYHDPHEKTGTRVQAASSILQYWFMVELASFLNPPRVVTTDEDTPRPPDVELDHSR